MKPQTINKPGSKKDTSTSKWIKHQIRWNWNFTSTWIKLDSTNFTLMQRFPVQIMCWIFPGTSIDLNLAGKSGALCGMCRSPIASTKTIFTFSLLLLLLLLSPFTRFNGRDQSIPLKCSSGPVEKKSDQADFRRENAWIGRDSPFRVTPILLIVNEWLILRRGDWFDRLMIGRGLLGMLNSNHLM